MPDVQTLTPATASSETLAALSAGAETLSSLSVDSPHRGFFPGTSLYEAPYPHPGSTSYPGDSIGLFLTALSAEAQTLSAGSADTQTLTPA